MYWKNYNNSNNNTQDPENSKQDLKTDDRPIPRPRLWTWRL